MRTFRAPLNHRAVVLEASVVGRDTVVLHARAWVRGTTSRTGRCATRTPPRPASPAPARSGVTVYNTRHMPAGAGHREQPARLDHARSRPAIARRPAPADAAPRRRPQSPSTSSSTQLRPEHEQLGAEHEQLGPQHEQLGARAAPRSLVGQLDQLGTVLVLAGPDHLLVHDLAAAAPAAEPGPRFGRRWATRSTRSRPARCSCPRARAATPTRAPRRSRCAPSRPRFGPRRAGRRSCCAPARITRTSSSTDDKRVTIQNYPDEAVWFDGSVPVTNWTQQGSTWVSTGWTRPVRPLGQLHHRLGRRRFRQPGLPDGGLARPGVRRRRPARAQVAAGVDAGAGQFAVDYNAHTLTIGSNPTGHAVRASDLRAGVRRGRHGHAARVRGAPLRHLAAADRDDLLRRRRTAAATWCRTSSIADNATQGVGIGVPNVVIDHVTHQPTTA